LAAQSLAANALNISALDLKAAVLRKLGRYSEAGQTATGSLEIDPLDFLGRE